ncbi:haloacid dehalogenase [Actinoplanes sp. SE50]|uniref:HAD family hydrolase n=1 Tax=unclassified Actinoplanes TaxID=2626549 RepID=UPI00023EC313|nr:MULTISPECIES: HAD family phosphatase [unclassified Actinoplanes]AEV86365.1 HAD-superfamily hydrolase, subfamily IA, variant 3 [Actinoplanes sp. SE50/110]ATO84762.1 haloacid dehalogenase [Actinoplanes sp. SE50]SLM02172.1 haloacid dehalogenase [Actinoplanes sp. SE50/110]
MLLPLPPGDFQAYLFDCDGTITDSMPVHFQAWQDALAEYECEFPQDLFYAWGGRPCADIVADLNARQGLSMPVAAVAERQESLFRAGLPSMRAVPGVLAHIEESYGRLPFGVVSGSTRPAVIDSLLALGLLDRFPVLVCAGDYTHPKPHPEPYLLGARRLGVDPARCLAFEDTELGVRAAQAAGMAVVRVPPPWER